MIHSRAVFLDRDGVINRKAPEGEYIRKWEEFVFLPGVKEALHKLQGLGFKLIIVTNQRGIARGLMTENDLKHIHNMMCYELEKVGVKIDAIYYCPHEKGTCRCRKPDTGMIEQALKDFPDIELDKSYVIGDSLSDMQMGEKAGCKNIFITRYLNEDINLFKEKGIKIYAEIEGMDYIYEYIN